MKNEQKWSYESQRKDKYGFEPGQTWPTTNYGDVVIVGFEITDSGEKVRVRYKDSGFISLVPKGDLYRGFIKDRSVTWLKDKIYDTKYFGKVKVIAETGEETPIKQKRVSVKFINTGSVRHNITPRDLDRGMIKDYWAPSVCGVGFPGEGYPTLNEEGRANHCYQSWVSMLGRVYGEVKSKSLDRYKRNGVKVHEDWHNFQNFAEWYHNYPYVKEEGWHLDKDWRVLGNTVYSPDTCAFVPSRINTFFCYDHDKKGYHRRGIHGGGDKWYCQVGSGVANESILHGPFKTDKEAFMKYAHEKLKLAQKLADEFEGKVHPEVIYNLRNLNIQPVFKEEE